MLLAVHESFIEELKETKLIYTIQIQMSEIAEFSSPVNFTKSKPLVMRETLQANETNISSTGLHWNQHKFSCLHMKRIFCTFFAQKR